MIFTDLLVKIILEKEKMIEIYDVLGLKLFLELF